MKIAYLFFIVPFVCACTGKAIQPKPETVIEQAKPEKPNDEQPSPLIMYVNTSGLRVRETPGTEGAIIGKLDNGTPVTVTGKSQTLVEIDGIHDCWYQIETKEMTGWVFGGYLSRTLDEYPKERYIGRYFYKDLIFIKGDTWDRNHYPAVVENGFIDIAHKEGDTFLFTFHCTDNRNIFDVDTQEIQFSGDPEKPFFKIEGEKGGGGTYYHFFHHGNAGIEFKFHHFSDLNGYLEEGEEPYPVKDVEFFVYFDNPVPGTFWE